MKYFLAVFISFVLIGCVDDNSSNITQSNGEEVTEEIAYYGNTQGTTFTVLCNDPIQFTMKEVTTILTNFDLALSGYIDSSIVSKLNNSGVGQFKYTDEYNYFNRCYHLSKEVYALSEGAFDPTIFPLFEVWGFMEEMENIPDSTLVDSLRMYLGFQNGHHFTLGPGTNLTDTLGYSIITKNTALAKLDFNAIAQGLAVDVLAEEIEKRGGKNYYVEIGGEIRVKGKNSDGETWRIGIDKPIENSNADNRVIQEVIHLENRSIATSGSYRKFYEKNGVKYSHTIDPKTGYPVSHTLLSATVVADNCALADAYATVFMVLGVDKSKAFIQAHPELNLDCYLTFVNVRGNYQTYYTPAFGKMIIL